MKYFFYLVPIFIIACKKENPISPPSTNPDLAPSIEWSSSYDGSAAESHGHFIMEASDNNYIQVGETGFIPNSAKILVTKVTQNGSLVWQKEIGQSGHNLGNSIFEVSDGYIVCGSQDQNACLVKLDKNSGTIIWNKTYDLGGSDAIENAVLYNNMIIAVGYKNALDANNTFYTEGQGVMITVDSNGQLIQQIDMNSSIAHAYRIMNHQSDLFIAGLSLDAQQYVLIKMDSSLQNIWKKEYGGSSSDHCFGMDIHSSGDIFLTGHTLSGTANWDTYTMKIDLNGVLLWEAKTGNPRGYDPNFIHDEAWGVAATPDGGCITVAGTGDEYAGYSSCQNGNCSDQWEVYLIKYSANGQIEWQNTYNPNGGDMAGEDVIYTSTNKIVVAVDDGGFGFLSLAP